MDNKYLTLVSIIIPVYNRENFVERCVKSVLAQTLRQIEIVVVDDGSIDNTGNICDQMAQWDYRLKVIHKQNGGPSSARNQGIRSATGKYIIFLDSDDYMMPNYCESLVEMQQRYGDEALCISNLVFIDERDEAKRVSSDFHDRGDTIILEQSALLDVYAMGLLNISCNKIYERSILMKYDILQSEDVMVGEDTLFVYKYLRNVRPKKFVIMKSIYYNAIIHDGESLSRKYYKEYFQTFTRIFFELEQLAFDFEVPEEKREILDNAYWDIIQNALHNNMRRDNGIFILRKIHLNNKILRDKTLQCRLESKKDIISFFEFYSYHSKNYIVVVIYRMLQKMWHSIKGK